MIIPAIAAARTHTALTSQNGGAGAASAPTDSTGDQGHAQEAPGVIR